MDIEAIKVMTTRDLVFILSHMKDCNEPQENIRDIVDELKKRKD